MRKKTVLTATVAMFFAMVLPPGLVIAEEVPTAADAGAADAGAGGKSVPESTTGSYIVVMKQDPLVTSIDASQLNSPDAKAQGDSLESTHDEVLADAGVPSDKKVQDYTNALNGFSVLASHPQAVALAANPKVAKVQPDELRQVTSEPTSSVAAASSAPEAGTQDDDLGRFLGLTGNAGAWANGINGEGVVVGVIDTGIWPEHPSFADDGKLPTPPDQLDGTERSSCDFGNTAANPNDAPFTCNNKLVGARQMLDTYRAIVGAEAFEFDSARDDNGHGTHTASTAAGDAGVQASIFGRKIAKISGIAPRAQIIAYKALGAEGGFTSDLAAAIDQAVVDGVDVINYSIGGGAVTVSADTIAFLFAADAGVLTAVSAGNSGPGPETIGGPADVPWVTAVGANTMSRSFKGTVRLAGGPALVGSSVTQSTARLPLVDALTSGRSDVIPANAELCLAGSLDEAKVEGKIVLCKRGGSGRVEKSRTVFDAGGAGMILYNATDTDNLFTDNFFLPTVMVDQSVGLKAKNYIAQNRNPRATLETGTTNKLSYAPSMTLFSSRGPNPTAADIIKPDITAPGIQILAGNTPMPASAPSPDAQPVGELFQAIAGTSMSSPVVAGMYALIKQQHPDWSQAAAKSAITTTANTRVRDNDRTSQAGPFAMGSGMVRPGKVADKGSPFNPGLVYEAGFVEYLGFLCDEGPEIFNNPEATCAELAGSGVPTEATDLNLSSIGVSQLAGTQTITRTVTSVADQPTTFRASVLAPSGYRVTVTPTQFTLPPGGSARYQVVITNRNGPVGEWRTGSISWTGGPAPGGNSGSSTPDAAAAAADTAASASLLDRTDRVGGKYEVRSPIAVRGAAIDVPAELTGTGANGSVSLPVKFGYTGPYTAAAHGLMAPVETTNEISQDPDQTFPSADDGAGVVAVPVTITGAAYARWRLALAGDSDLDIYLLDSSGTVMAQSTNGGTDEEINLPAPPDGNYTLIVHGWQVVPDPLAFTLQNWIVPTSSDGSLTVASAPSSAAIGATGTVTANWTGAAPGVSYLGAVSHSNATGVLALTLLDVTG